MMTNVSDVKKFHGLKPQDLRFEKDNDAELDRVIVDWISQAEDMIKSYTNNDFKKEVPGTVKNVCTRLVSNMIQVAIQRRETPIIKVNDWSITTGSSAVFTDDLKEDLKPFRIEKSHTADKVSFLAITGDD